MEYNKNQTKNILLGESIVTDIVWELLPDGGYVPHILIKSVHNDLSGTEVVSIRHGCYYNTLKRRNISKGCKVKIWTHRTSPDIAYIGKVVGFGSGDMCLPKNTFISNGIVWSDTERTRQYVGFSKSMKGILDRDMIEAFFDCGITDILSLIEYLHTHDLISVIHDLSRNCFDNAYAIVDRILYLRNKISKLDYYELLKLMNIPNLRSSELKVIALKLSGYEVSETDMKNVRSASICDFLNNAEMCNRIKSVAIPFVKSEMTTIIGKVGDSVTIEIQTLPDDFSFAYTFFRNYRQELDLLKKEIEKAQSTEDKLTSFYLESAQKYIEGCMRNQVAYVGGCSIPPVLDTIQTLAYSGTLLFSHSVAYCVKNRIEKEVAVIRKECEYCKLADKITSSSEMFEQLITIIRDANCETDAVDKLQSEMSLRADEAEFMLNVSMSTLSDRDLISGKTISMLNLLGYLTYLKTIINS